MEIFTLSLQQLLMMALLIVTGYILRKKKFLPENSGEVVSKLENYVFVPALSIITQFNNCTVDNFIQNSELVLHGLIFVTLSIVCAYPISKLFVKNSALSAEADYRRNIYKYALTFGNHGFMGNFLVLGIWGDEMLFRYLMATFFVVVISSSWGLCIFIPKVDKSNLENIKKGLLSLPLLALIFGITGGLLNLKAYIPQFVMSALENASKCMGPAAMLLAGIIIGGYDLKKLFSDKGVYAVSFLRLVIVPSLFMIILNFIGAGKDIMTFILICFATPIGLNTIVFPAAYGGETKTGAAMTVISHTICIITIPIMYYLFIVLL